MTETLSYAGLGGAVLAAVAWFFWATMRRAAKRASSEGLLDDRAVAIADRYAEMLRHAQAESIALRAELVREREDLWQKITNVVDRIKREHADAMASLRARLDRCDDYHAECREENLRCREELAEMRARVNIYAGPPS